MFNSARSHDKTDEDTHYSLIIPADLLSSVPDHIIEMEEKLSDYLLSALKIGLEAMARAGVNLDTGLVRRTFDQLAEKVQAIESGFHDRLEQILDAELSGEDSKLARELKLNLGEEGRLSQNLEDLRKRLADPENVNSIPGSVRILLEETFSNVERTLTKTLDMANPESPLKRLLDEQRDSLQKQKEELIELQAVMRKEVNQQLKEFRKGLKIDDIIEEKEAALAEEVKRGTRKGLTLEEQVTEVLVNCTNRNRDEVELIGESTEDGSRRKSGDVLIKVMEPGFPDQRIVLEVKAGKFTMRGEDSIGKQLIEAMQIRAAQGGIGVTTFQHKGDRQLPFTELGDDRIIVSIDSDEDNWLTLEVAYQVIRARIIANLRTISEQEIDIGIIDNSIQEILTALGTIQKMKRNCTDAIGIVEGVRRDISDLESAIKAQVGELQGLVRSC